MVSERNVQLNVHQRLLSGAAARNWATEMHTKRQCGARGFDDPAHVVATGAINARYFVFPQRTKQQQHLLTEDFLLGQAQKELYHLHNSHFTFKEHFCSNKQTPSDIYKQVWYGSMCIVDAAAIFYLNMLKVEKPTFLKHMPSASTQTL